MDKNDQAGIYGLTKTRENFIYTEGGEVLIKSTVRFRFGDKLRTIRERRGITLKDVAEKAKVSESLVSQIERNKVSPSIDTLLTLADVLDIDLEYLFQDYKKNKKVHIVRAGERQRIVQGDVSYHQLSTLPDVAEEHAIEAFFLEIGKDAEKGDREYGHMGKELGVVLEGEGELVYGTETYKLNQGDSVSFPSDIPHILRNTGRGTLKAIWVITPPRNMMITGKK
ncbi:MAG: XRE family transcriptional regulator [Proteobacteria bacterium]|nr:XRE family transcriptional regulator [Pseudomonadota bacterium]